MNRNHIQLTIISLLAIALVVVVTDRQEGSQTATTTTLTTQGIRYEVDSCQWQDPEGLRGRFEVRFRWQTTDGSSRVGQYRWYAADQDGNVFAEQDGWSSTYRVNPALSAVGVEYLYLHSSVELTTFRNALTAEAIRCRAKWVE